VEIDTLKRRDEEEMGVLREENACMKQKLDNRIILVTHARNLDITKPNR